ncbi:MAG TPA: hypothetical protein VJ846_06865 [Sphingomicrobium sp.]|nr:hypothetical protein [Sphingomicrobium sp.]
MEESKEMTVAEAQPPQQVALTVQERAVIALGGAERENELKALAQKYADITEVKNKAGRQQVHAAAMELSKAITQTEKTGEAAREDAVAFQKAVIAEVKSHVAIIKPPRDRLIALRDAWDEVEATEKAAKLAAEQARINAIRSRIDVFRNAPAEMVGKSAQQIGACADHLSETVIALEEFEGSTGEAVMARNAAVARLREMQAAQAAHEAEQARLATERAQLERERAEAAERERVASEARAEQERKDREAREVEEARLAKARDEAERKERASLAEIAKRDEEVRKALAEEKRLQEEAAQRTADAMSEISGIQQQVAIAISGRLGVRKGGTIECIQDTLAETEAWEIDSERFGVLAGAAEMAKATTVAEIRRLLVEAEEKIAAEAKAAADKLEADHAEALSENERIDRERAEVKRQADEAHAAEQERIRRAQAEFEATGPEDWEIVQVVADHYDVSADVARHWLARHVWMERAA